MSPTTHTAVSLLEPFGGHVKIQRVDCADISLYLQATVPDPHWGLPFSCKQPRLALMAAASLVISYSSESWLSRRRNGLLCRRLQCCVDWEQYTNWTNVLLRSFFAWTYQNNITYWVFCPAVWRDLEDSDTRLKYLSSATRWRPPPCDAQLTASSSTSV